MEGRFGLIYGGDSFTPQKYITDLKPEMLEYINKFGIKQSYEYFSERNSKITLVDRHDNNMLFSLHHTASGGNFLINCLSLSKDIEVSDLPTPEDRVRFLCSCYDSETKYWNDVSLSSRVPPKIAKYYFFISHPEVCKSNTLWNFWPYSDKIILFKNSSLFVSLRKCVLPTHKFIDNDGFIKHEKIQTQEVFHHDSINKTELKSFLLKHNIDLINYRDLSNEKKTKLKKLFNDRKQVHSVCRLKSKKQIYFWDVNWYLDEEEFICGMKFFYDGLQLTGFNDKLLRRCYMSWMNAMYRNIRYNSL